MTSLGASRYERQLLISGIGQDGQKSLHKSCVTVIGAGGLGYPILSYLAAAGVSVLRVVDADRIEVTNLNRQLFYADSDIGESKAPIAAMDLNRKFPNTTAVPIAEYVDSENVDSILEGSDIVIDAVDNLETRYVLNQWAVEHARPIVFGAIEGLRGMVYLYDGSNDSAPCYECIFHRKTQKNACPPPVLGATAGVIGSWQAAEAIMYICGMRHTESTLIEVDIRHSYVRRHHCKRRSSCPCDQER